MLRFSAAHSDELTQEVTGTYGGVTFPWPGELDDVWDTMTSGDRPLEVDEYVNHYVKLPIDSTWPSV